jgi:hypothetical protein
MSAGRWKKLAGEVADVRIDTERIGRLRARIDSGGGVDAVEEELKKECASALGRAEDKVIAALRLLDELGKAVDEAEALPRDDRWAARVDGRVEAFNRQRRDADRYLWELRIQREAIGVRRHEILARAYPLPPPRNKAGA